MVDAEAQSMRRVFAFALAPLVRSAPADVRAQVLGTLRALGQRYQLEAGLLESWS